MVTKLCDAKPYRDWARLKLLRHRISASPRNLEDFQFEGTLSTRRWSMTPRQPAASIARNGNRPVAGRRPPVIRSFRFPIVLNKPYIRFKGSKAVCGCGKPVSARPGAVQPMG